MSLVDERVAELLTRDSDEYAGVAHLLCDRYEPERRAFRIVGADLSTQDITYGELREESERFAAALKALGIGPDDRVATLMGKSRRYLVALMAIWRLGAVHVPLFTAFAPPAIAYRLDGSAAKIVICDESQREKLAADEDIPAKPDWRVITTGPSGEDALSFDALLMAKEPGIPAAQTGGDAPLIHIYTSGTTGNPKGVIVPVRALASFHAYCEFGFDLRNEDVFWCAGRSVLVHGSLPRPLRLARLRHVHGKRDGRSARFRARDLPAASLVRHWPRRSPRTGDSGNTRGTLWNGVGVRRQSRSGQHVAKRSNTGRGIHHMAWVS